MAITVKYLEGLGIDKETAEKIFAERGVELEAEKAKREKIEKELKEKDESLNSLTAEIGKLKKDSKNADELQTKLDSLIAEREAEKKKAEAEKLLREREENNRAMFNKAVEACGKTKDDWNGKFTEEGYYREFVKAIEADENKGKAHSDILHELVKDDKAAFKGVTPVKLVGGTNRGIQTASKYSTREEICGIKDKTTRQTEMLARPDLFPEIKI